MRGRPRQRPAVPVCRVVEVVEAALRGETVRLLAKKALPSLDLPKVRGLLLAAAVPPMCMGGQPCPTLPLHSAARRWPSFSKGALVLVSDH